MSALYTEEEVAKIKDRILEALEMVIDPELGIDIVNLGLVYEIRFDDGETEIDMTLTTMGCPLADLLTDQIYDVMRDIPEVTNVEVKLVWTPAWSVEKSPLRSHCAWYQIKKKRDEKFPFLRYNKPSLRN